jgi:carbonic anhydrase/acetyltransferase-like protein (isoleucine patch superfamily)
MAMKALIIAERAAHITGFPGDTPVACVEVLGGTLLARILRHLVRSGFAEIVVVSDIEPKLVKRGVTSDGKVRFVHTSTAQLWRSSERAFEDMESAGVRGVAVMRADHYAEIDWQGVLAHHMHFRNRVTRIWCGDEPCACDIFMVSAARRNEAAALMRNTLHEERTPGVRYRIGPAEYINELRDCHMLHRLTKDALYGLNHIDPVASEVRPGVWIGEGARIENEARLVAPVFVGAHARVHRGAVITRDSVLEQHATVDCGTIVEDSLVQPYTALGAGLDVAHAVVNGMELFHLLRNAGFATADQKLLRERKQSAVVRTAQAAAALLSYIPAQIMRSNRKPAVAVADCASPIKVELEPQPENVAKLAPGLAVVRRYGNE